MMRCVLLIFLTQYIFAEEIDLQVNNLIPDDRRWVIDLIRNKFNSGEFNKDIDENNGYVVPDDPRDPITQPLGILNPYFTSEIKLVVNEKIYIGYLTVNNPITEDMIGQLGFSLGKGNKIFNFTRTIDFIKHTMGK